MRDTSAACRIAVRLIFPSEGCRLRSYLDSVASPPVWTIGHGTTRINGKPVTAGMTCSMEQADAWAEADIEIVIAQVLRVVKVALDDHQLAALCSLTYNVGIGHFLRSSVLEALNLALYSIAANRFLEYCHAGGKVVAGLAARRELEREVFMTEMGRPTAPTPREPESEADKLNAAELNRLRNI
jgi:lysozyme